MNIGPMSFVTRCHCNGTPTDSWLIASLHWRRSITWRWILTWSRFNSNVKRGVHRLPWARNIFIGVNLPIIGHWHFQTQENMWR